jgi:hypothetical protein
VQPALRCWFQSYPLHLSYPTLTHTAAVFCSATNATDTGDRRNTPIVSKW